MARTVNKQGRQARMEEILVVAKQQFADSGAEGLSLRAVARRLEMAPNSIYNYYPSLDDLITALLVDAFQRLAEVLEVTVQRSGTFRERLLELCFAYRTWAIDNPDDYDLIFGRPLPGYQAPADVTGRLSLRALRSGLDLLVDAWHAGMLIVPEHFRDVPISVLPHVSTIIKPSERDVPHNVYTLMLAIWAYIHGLVTLEIHGNYDATTGDTAAFYRYAVTGLVSQIGLR